MRYISDNLFSCIILSPPWRKRIQWKKYTNSKIITTSKETGIMKFWSSKNDTKLTIQRKEYWRWGDMSGRNCKRENHDRNHRCYEPPTHDPNKVIPPATLQKYRNSGVFYFPVNRRRTVNLPN